jgi:hypothetical protein
VPCPEHKKLEVGHGKLGDLVSRSAPPWLPGGTAELLDDVVGDQSCHHLVVVEGFRRPLAKQEYTLEHINSGLADPSLKENSILSWVIAAVFVLVLILEGQLVIVNAPIILSLSTCLEGFILSGRHQAFPPGLGAWSIGISLSSLRRCGISRHCKVKSGQVGRRLLSVVHATVVAGQWSVPAVARRSIQHGSDKQN